MPLSVVGVDHSTCPLEIREPLAASILPEGAALREALNGQPEDEALLLSTCARTEMYLWSEHGIEGLARGVHQLLIALSPGCAGFVMRRDEDAAVRHAFRVAAGLESQVVGEYEITGQIRSMLQRARAMDIASPNLESLFHSAIACSRRLRRETILGSADVSVAASAAAMYADKRNVSDSSILIIGTGKVARMLAAKFRGARELVVTGRNEAVAASLANRMGGERMLLSDAVNRLAQFDAVCCATQAKHPLLVEENFQEVESITVFDVSIPRNVAASVGNLPGVTLYDVDAVVPAEGSSMVVGSPLVESILDAEVHDYVARLAARKTGPIIAALREHVDRVREQELLRISTRLGDLDANQRASIELLTQRLIDRMFHHLVVRLKLAALTDPNLVEAAEFFFAHGNEAIFPGVDQAPEAAVSEPVAIDRA